MYLQSFFRPGGQCRPGTANRRSVTLLQMVSYSELPHFRNKLQTIAQ